MQEIKDENFESNNYTTNKLAISEEELYNVSILKDKQKD